jgi:hypothetical protein
MKALAIWAAALSFAADKEQCPRGVIPMMETVSDVCAEVVRFAGMAGLMTPEQPWIEVAAALLRGEMRI